MRGGLGGRGGKPTDLVGDHREPPAVLPARAASIAAFSAISFVCTGDLVDHSRILRSLHARCELGQLLQARLCGADRKVKIADDSAEQLRAGPLQPAFIMANSGEAVSYAELEARSIRLAHLLRRRGLKRLDHYAIFMENNSRYLEACGAGERSGLYFTCINSFLTGGEIAYIVNNSQSRILITSTAKLEVAREALKQCPNVELCIVADGAGESERIVGLQEATAGPCGLNTRWVDAGLLKSLLAGRTGRGTKLPPQLGQTPPSLFSTQSRQNVHSKVQIMASVAAGGRYCRSIRSSGAIPDYVFLLKIY